MSLVSWGLLSLVDCSHDLKSDGIQEVVGSIPIGSTALRSGNTRASGGKPSFSTRMCCDVTALQSEGCPPKPPPPPRLRRIPRSFNEGELAPGLRSRSGRFGGVGKGDYLFLFAPKPPELRVASHFFTTHDMLSWNIFQERPAFAAEAAAWAE